MKRTTSTRAPENVAPLKLFGIMVVTSLSTFATLVTIYQSFFTHSLYA